MKFPNVLLVITLCSLILGAPFSSTDGYLQPCSMLRTGFFSPVLFYVRILGSPVLCHLRVFCSPVSYTHKYLAALFCATYEFFFQSCFLLRTDTGSPVLCHLRVWAALFSSTYKHLAALFCAAYGFLQPCFLLHTDTWLLCSVSLMDFCCHVCFYVRILGCPVLFHLRVFADLFCFTYWYLQPCFVLFSCICSPAIFFSPKMCAIFCTPCTRDCSLRFAILFFVTAHLCSKQGSILEQMKPKQHTNCGLVSKSSVPRPITSGVYCTVCLSRLV